MGNSKLIEFEERMNEYSGYLMAIIASFGPYVIALAPGTLLYTAVSAVMDSVWIGLIVAVANEVAGLASSKSAVIIYAAKEKGHTSLIKLVITGVLSCVYLVVNVAFAFFAEGHVSPIIVWAVAGMPFMIYSVYIILAFRTEVMDISTVSRQDAEHTRQLKRKRKEQLLEIELEGARMKMQKQVTGAQGPQGDTRAHSDLRTYILSLSDDELEKLNKAGTAREWNVSRTTVYDYIKQAKNGRPM